MSRPINGIYIFELVKTNNTALGLISSFSTPQEQGRVFEILWNIIIRFGFCKTFPNNKYHHLEGNMNYNDLHRVKGIKRHLLNLSSTKTGASDVTLKDKVTEEYIFISCKYFEGGGEKNIDDYDIHKIRAVIPDYPTVYKKYLIFLCVNSRRETLNVLNRSERSNKHLKDAVGNNVLGMEEMECGYKLLKQYIQNLTIDDLESQEILTKPYLSLRLHQNVIVHKVYQGIASGYKHFLIGAKPRSGKTFCIGGLIVKYRAERGRINVLIITSAPNETRKQFIDDLFLKFREFGNMGIFFPESSKDLNNIVITKDSNIFFVSKQLLQNHPNNVFGDVVFDAIVSDENHFQGTTELSQKILSYYISPNTATIYMTATYNKTLLCWHIPKECRFYWELQDEILCKKRDVAGLIKRQGEVVSLFLTEENKEAVLSEYDIMPEFHILTNSMHPDRYKFVSQNIQGTTCGFSTSVLFSYNENGESFNYPKDVDVVLRNIGGQCNCDDSKYPNSARDNLCFYERIRNDSVQNGSRTLLNNTDFSTQLWFLSHGRKNMLLNTVSKLLKKRMLRNYAFQNYSIIIVNIDQNIKGDIKKYIENEEFRAKDEGKDGLIVLVGGQLTLGVSLPLVDIVVLLTDSKADDNIIQKIYRCMTEGTSSRMNRGTKKFGYVIDFNISRVVNTMQYLIDSNRSLSSENSLQYIIENSLIHIDSDLCVSRESKTKLIENLITIWKQSGEFRRNIIINQMKTIVIDIEAKEQKLLNKYFSRLKSERGFVEQTLFDDSTEEQQLPSGRNVSIEEKIEEEVEISPISFTKDILPYVVPLICVLTMRNEEDDIEEMLKKIEEKSSLAFEECMSIWWNGGKKMVELIKRMILKYVKNDLILNSVITNIKMSLSELLDKPLELLEYLDSCLKSKVEEKQKYGEVFTPTSVINQKLDELDKHFTEAKGCSIFTKSSYRWGDVAGSGMGNYSICVFVRLMEGLKEKFPDFEQRKTHILENMLYMAEINKKNVFVCRQIFGDKYKLNLYEGDALDLDCKDEWGFDSFDVIVGNPPYNKGGIRSHTGSQLAKNIGRDDSKTETIWPKFVIKALRMLKPKGYLAFMHPLSWLKNTHEIHNHLLSKHIFLLTLWDDSESKRIIKGDIPISLYVLQNISNSKDKLTKIISILRRQALVSTSVVYLNRFRSIPLAYHSALEKLRNFINKNELAIEFKTTEVKSKGELVPLPQNYTVEDGWVVDRHRIKDGILVRKADEHHPDLTIPKLIIANKSSFTGAFVDDGRLGLTKNHKFYIVGENLDILQRMLEWKLMKAVVSQTRYAQHYLDPEAFKYVPDIRKIKFEGTEREFMEMIGFTEEEIGWFNPIIVESDSEE